MKLISHRGNITHQIESAENNPDYIDEAIKQKYDVEVDIWYIDGELFLGHDKPQYKIKLLFLTERYNVLWVHCKNLDAVSYLFKYNKEHYDQIHYFWHQTDDVTLTSQGFIWAYPGKQPLKDSIAVMPEYKGDAVSYKTNIGVCSDNIQEYMKFKK